MVIMRKKDNAESFEKMEGSMAKTPAGDDCQSRPRRDWEEDGGIDIYTVKASKNTRDR